VQQATNLTYVFGCSGMCSDGSRVRLDRHAQLENFDNFGHIERDDGETSARSEDDETISLEAAHRLAERYSAAFVAAGQFFLTKELTGLEDPVENVVTEVSIDDGR
jgi:hypothetical protein